MKVAHDSMKRTKTYQYLEAALLQLLETKKYEDITVLELVTRAGVSRTAFYTQFGTKQDFTARIIADTNRQATIISTQAQSMDFFSEDNFVDYYTRLYRYIHSRNRLYRVMLSQNGLPQFREAMRAEASQIWREKYFSDRYLQHYDGQNGRNHEIVLAYIVSAHIGLVEFWLENGMRETPKEMAHLLYDMTWRVLRGIHD